MAGTSFLIFQFYTLQKEKKKKPDFLCCYSVKTVIQLDYSVLSIKYTL